MPNVPTYQSTWHQNLARHASDARFPGLWKGVISNWQPGLGPTGLTLHDLSGRGNNGALTNVNPATDWVLDGGRHALVLNGVNEYVDLGNYTLMDGLSQLTVSFWLNHNEATFSGFEGLFSRGKSSQRTPWIFGSDGEAILDFRAETTTGVNNITLTSAAITQGLWQLATFTWDGSTAISYLDGLAGNTDVATSGTLVATDGENHIGFLKGFESFNGKLDDIIIYNRGLLSSEVQLLYQLGRGGWLARRRRVFAKAPAAPTGIGVGRHYPRGVGRGIGRGVAV